jgi:hypothetical protein
MKFTKLTLAITFVAASAFLCACDDSSSAKDDASENNATPTQTPPQSNTFTTNEKFTYVFTLNEKECGWKIDITDMQFNFSSSTTVKITTKDANGSETVTGIYRESIDEDGYKYYLIQIKDLEGVTLKYYPNEAVIITSNELAQYLTGSESTVKSLESEFCAE